MTLLIVLSSIYLTISIVTFFSLYFISVMMDEKFPLELSFTLDLAYYSLASPVYFAIDLYRSIVGKK